VTAIPNVGGRILSAGQSGLNRAPEAAVLASMGMLGLVKNCQGRDDKNRCQEEFAHAGSFGEHRGRILAAWKRVCRMAPHPETIGKCAVACGAGITRLLPRLCLCLPRFLRQLVQSSASSSEPFLKGLTVMRAIWWRNSACVL
jgi:hypothetical protein